MNSINILLIDTSTSVCSVGISSNGKLIEFVDIDEANIHASRLTLLINDLLVRTGFDISDLSAVAVGKGPGSYTGLRIGVSTAKGICYAADIPLIAVNSLHALALGFCEDYPDLCTDPDVFLAPMIDARRMEVYRSIYNGKLEELVGTEAIIMDSQSFEWIEPKQKIYLFGNGADKLNDLYAESKNIIIIPDFRSSAKYMSSFSEKAFLQADFVDLAYFEPYYLKNFIPTTPKVK